MPQPTLEQILADMAVKRPPQPWDTPMGEPHVRTAPVSAPVSIPQADDPLTQALRRERMMQGFAQYGQMANPETSSKGGLVQMLMSLLPRVR